MNASDRAPSDAATLNTVCSRCLAVNRLAAARLHDACRCGKCGEALLVGDPMELDDNHFDRLTKRETLPAVVDFWATWCGPCHAMAPAFAAAARELRYSHRFIKVDVDEATATARRFGILSIPTLVLLREGREVGRTSGVMRTPQLVSWVLSTAQPSPT